MIQKLPIGWEINKLNDVIVDIIDYRGKTPKKLGSNWSESGIIALSAMNVKQGQLVNLEKAKFVSEELYRKWMKVEVTKGDILMTSEAPLGETYLVPNNRKICLSQRLFCIRANPSVILPQFLFYFFNSSISRKQIESKATGTTVLGIRQPDLREVPVSVPSLPTQRKIAAVLSAYDDLIENNTRRIKILEDMAQTLYREWFVHFRFPGYENVPMVESPLGPIPHGWETMQIKEIVDDYIGGGWGKEKEDSKHTVPAHVIRGTDFIHVRHVRTDTCPLRFHTQSNFKSRQLEVDDIVIEISGGGKEWGVGRSILVTPQMLRAFEEQVICASFCKRLTLNSEIYSPLIFMMYLQEAYTNKNLEQYELRSTGIRNFQFATFLEREWIPVPSPSIQKHFVVKARSLIDAIQNLGARNVNLRQTRDLLLPKLISGKIDVSEIDLDTNGMPRTTIAH